MIKLLVVEDSPVVRDFLIHTLSQDPEIQVIGIAGNGEEAVRITGCEKPDVITMDINMPRMNGFEATRKIMETHPTPIIIVSGSLESREVEMTFHALEAGALAALPRPRGNGHPDFEATAKELIQTVKLMSEVKVVRRWPRSGSKPTKVAIPQADVQKAAANIEVVAIGASTGGPIVLQTILSALPQSFPAPLLIVQHITPGFVGGFTEWLAKSSGFPVHVAAFGQALVPGQVYVAPDGFHMEVGINHRIGLTKADPENGMCPSISHLFRSVANTFRRSAVGVLLTGMGRDGAEELKMMKDQGAITIAQDEESSVVYGMPREAIKLNAATFVLPPEGIAAALATLVKP